MRPLPRPALVPLALVVLSLLAAPAFTEAEPPVLSEEALAREVTVSFPGPVPLYRAYGALAETAGIRIAVDPEIRDRAVALDLGTVSLAEALRALDRAATTFSAPVGPDAVLVVPDTPADRRQHEPLGIRTFRLHHVDPVEVDRAFRSLIEARRVAVDREAGTVVIRDTLDKLEVAEAIVASLDAAPTTASLSVTATRLHGTTVPRQRPGAPAPGDLPPDDTLATSIVELEAGGNARVAVGPVLAVERPDGAPCWSPLELEVQLDPATTAEAALLDLWACTAGPGGEATRAVESRSSLRAPLGETVRHLLSADDGSAIEITLRVDEIESSPEPETGTAFAVGTELRTTYDGRLPTGR